jgi:predicted Holliday junction resolvase-like endonuclease
MSVIAIVVIVVVALVLLAFAFAVRRILCLANVKRRELDLGHQRKRVTGEHHEHPPRRARKAGQAGLRARIAELEARRERAEVRVRRETAALNQQGIADQQLVEPYVRADPTRLEDFRASRRDGARGSEPAP